MRLRILILLAFGLLQSAWAQACATTIGAVHAAQELPGASGRPADGWKPVTLPDTWTTHWPGYSGVVWYRISLNQDCSAALQAQEPVALLATSINMAGEVYLNDTLLWRDASMQEPLSRSWNMPRYWILPQAALQPDGNAIWIRIQGEALVQPGLGTIRVGPAAQLLELHEHFVWSNRTIFKINLIGTLFITALFSGIWLLNRKQSVHGWFAALNLAWAMFIYNVIATDPWPFQEVASVARFNAIAFMVFCSCYCIFIFELQGRALPHRLQRGLQAVTLGMSLLVALMPEKHLESTMDLGTSSHMLVFAIASIAPLVYAWRSRSLKGVLPALPGLLMLCVAVYDLNRYLLKTSEPITLAPYTSLFAMILITGVLGARIAASMRRTERFNVELTAAVEQACRELETTMDKEHQTALSNSRLQERLQFIHDLHDGFGSALVRAIIQAERNADTHPEASRHVSTLRSLRDDLRNVIDGRHTAHSATPATPAEWLAPTRHRFSTLFDELDMTSHWTCATAWSQPPSVAFCMELTRLLEEALSNVLKHSAATQVDVTLAVDAHGALTLEVRDNGVGFDVAAMAHEAGGLGLSSMQARVARLGGQLHLESRSGHSQVRAHLPA